MSIFSMVNWKRLVSVLVPGVLIAAISIYVLGFRAPPSPNPKVLPGKALAAYDDLYPIRANTSVHQYRHIQNEQKEPRLCSSLRGQLQGDDGK